MAEMAKRSHNLSLDSEVVDEAVEVLPNRKLSAFVCWLLRDAMVKLRANPRYWLEKKTCRSGHKEDNHAP